MGNQILFRITVIDILVVPESPFIMNVPTRPTLMSVDKSLNYTQDPTQIDDDAITSPAANSKGKDPNNSNAIDYRNDYTVKSRGTNSQGNRYCNRDYGPDAPNPNPYHYSNRDGSYFYSNPDGSKYYNDGRGGYKYQRP